MSNSILEKYKAEREKKKIKEKAKKEKKAKELKKKKNKAYYLKNKKPSVKKTPKPILIKTKAPIVERGFYMVITTSLNRKIKTLGISPTLQSATEKFDHYIEELNKDVRFPTKYIITNGILQECKYEILLVKKRKLDEPNVLLRNDIGQFVEHIVADKETFIILDKHELLVEETFFVYGFHPKFQRKTFNFILNKLVINDETEPKEIICYRNKLIIETSNNMNIIICKNTNDVYRLYIELMEECIYNKKIHFMGIISLNSHLERTMRQKIMDKTGWNKTKVMRITTRP